MFIQMVSAVPWSTSGSTRHPALEPVAFIASSRELSHGLFAVIKVKTTGWQFCTVLYDSTMEEGARLDTLSLLMKGETLPAGTTSAGNPASWAGLNNST